MSKPPPTDEAGKHRALLRLARSEGWSDEKRAEYGLGPARPRGKTKTETVAGGNKKKSNLKTQKNKDNVVGLFDKEKVASRNKGGIVPPSGNPDNEADPRGRKKLWVARLGKRWSQIIDDIRNHEYTWEELVETLSPEELARGQLKDKNGGFVGRPPSFVPRAFHDACIRELLLRGKELYKENYVAAIKAMTDIATNPGVKESDRIKAATFVIERLEGKVPDQLVVTAADPWQAIISDIVAEVEDDQIARAQDYLNRAGDVASGNET